MLLWPPLTGTQLSPVAPRSWVLSSSHTPGNRHDRWAKPGEGLRCGVCLHTREVKNDATRTLKKSLKQLQINPVNWEELAQDRPAWRKFLKTGAAIYEANRIAAAKAKMAARKSQASPINTANAQVLPTDNNFIDAPPPTITDTILPPPPLAPITATKTTCPTLTTSVAISDYLPPATSNTTTASCTSDGDSVLSCRHCDHTFTSHISLVGHL
ncbi:unnamed protein product [Schistocephalus solidus]|uniref:C2H2-type domain-containing protein n=1 Tax=Schistocephalus solidus TaxID=70667 RepID=A0A183SFR3_SCHSO|nr:unnamed protein product [Schistocephalus solidus]